MSTALEYDTLPPENVNNSPFRERQAFAMIQMLLRVSHHWKAEVQIRSLFPEECFTYRLSASLLHDSDIVYDRIRGVGKRTTSLDGDTELLKLFGNPCKVLTRGHLLAVNKLLDWLSIIFEAILNQSLDGVQFSLYADKANPAHVLESYTFSFQYTRSHKNAKRQLSGIAGRGLAGTSSTMGAASAGLKELIDPIHGYHQILAALPAECYMMCHLLYSPLHSPYQQPIGFQHCKDTTILVPDNSEWRFVQRDFGQKDLPFYWYQALKTKALIRADRCSVGLGIAFMAETKQIKGRSEEEARIPDNLIYSRTLLRTFQLEKSRFHFPSALTQQPSHLLDQSSQHIHVKSRTTMQSRCAQLSVPVAETDRLRRGRKRLSNDSGLSDSISNKPSDEALIQAQAPEPRVIPPHTMQEAVLLRAKEIDMIAKSLRLQRKHPALMGCRTIRCQCGIDRQEGPQMMQCKCCGTWQHFHCYGFLIDQPGEQHYCYQCLLEDSSMDRLSDMKQLAHFRRALWIVYDLDTDSTRYTPKSLAQKLGFDDIKKAAKLFARLKNEGFLTRVKFPSAVRTRERHQDRIRVYGDPFTSIGIFYNLRESGCASKIQVEDVMPPRKHAKSGRVEEVAIRVW